MNTAAIASAEESLAMLRRLASLGMCLAEDICERAIGSPYHPEIKHEPGRSFATVSRAVRLTLVLKAKVEASLIALRNGETVLAAPMPRHGPDCASNPAMAAPDEIAGGSPDDDALETLDRARESLREYERFDEIPSRPFDDCVAAIRADLGLPAGSDGPSCSADVSSASVGATVAGETPARRGVPKAASETSIPRIGALDAPDTG